MSSIPKFGFGGGGGGGGGGDLYSSHLMISELAWLHKMYFSLLLL